MSSFAPFEKIDEDRSSGLLILCDHARNTLPEEYGDLGLPESEFSRHIAYDIGSEGVGRGLAQKLGVPMLMTTYSRLLIDPNRGEDDPTIVMRLSDGTVIPGNHPISKEEINHRIETFHRPYHNAIKQELDAFVAEGVIPCIFSIHTFTDNWKGTKRPWEAAILWDSDPRMVHPLLEMLREDDQIMVGDNEPYDGALGNDTMNIHCTKRGFAHALIEIRQDLLGDEAGITSWVERLAPMLEKLTADPQMHQIAHFGTRTRIDVPRTHTLDDEGKLIPINNGN